MIYWCTVCVIRYWTLSLCLDVLDNSTQKCDFLRMYFKGYVWSYIGWNPICRTAQSALHFTPWHTFSFRHQLDFSGKHQACCKYYAKTIHSRICMLHSPSLARYSFIQLRELGVVEITNSASLWPFIVFIERLNLQFVCDSDSAACMGSEWSAQSKHYSMWYIVLHNPLNYNCYPVGFLH